MHRCDRCGAQDHSKRGWEGRQELPAGWATLTSICAKRDLCESCVERALDVRNALPALLDVVEAARRVEFCEKYIVGFTIPPTNPMRGALDSLRGALANLDGADREADR